jgi:hypothetical protein
MTKDLTQQQAVSSPGAELHAARKVINSFIAAFKALSFYPEEHAFTRKSFSRLIMDLNGFLAEYPELRLEIAKNSFYYEDDLLLDGEPEENNPAYLLTRDGLLYLQFFQGIESREIATLLHILVRYRNPVDHEEGDIVTALWQAELEHIAYEEVDIFTLEGFEFNLSGFQVTPAAASPDKPGDTDGDRKDSASSRSAQPTASEEYSAAEEHFGEEHETQMQAGKQDQSAFMSELLEREQGESLIDISAEEKRALDSLIAEEEHKDFTSDVIDVLLILLASQKNMNNFAGVLEFIRQQFFSTMDRGAFHLSYKLLNNLVIIRKQLQGVRSWVGTLVDEFMAALAAEENLSALSWVSGSSSLANHSLHQSYLWKVLRLLPPDILFTLGPLAGRMPMEMVSIRNELLAILEGKAAAAPDSFKEVLEKADQNTALMLSPLVENLPAEKKIEVYLQMTRHAAAEVRKLGLDGYMMTTADPDFTSILPLLGDEHPLTRERMIGYLFDAGPATAEAVLVRFLQEDAQKAEHDQRYIFDYYKALGQCGSEECVPFLEQMLLKGNLGSMFSNRNSMHKKGAAQALQILGTPECQAILDKGRQSLRPDIRLACQHAQGK